MSSEVATQLEQDATKRMYERLIAARDKPKDADETVIKDLEGSRMFQDAFCCADPIYQQQIATILASKPENVTANTVGSYLYGCFQPELAVEVACTPECATGLKNPELGKCDIASYEKKGKLTKVNSVVSEEANVFLDKGETLTAEDKKVLREQGIKVATTYNRDGTSINYVLGESFNVSDPAQDVPQTTNDNSSSSTNTAWAWVWIIIAIVLIIIIALLLSR